MVAQIIDALGLEAVMFEAADPAVFEWYIKNYGAEVNLFIDHSQIVQLECLRAGILGDEEHLGPRHDLQALKGLRNPMGKRLGRLGMGAAVLRYFTNGTRGCCGTM